MNIIVKLCRFYYILQKEQSISAAFFPSPFFLHLICIVDDLNPKRNWKLRPTQCKAVIDANLALNALHPLYNVHPLYTLSSECTVDDSAKFAREHAHALAAASRIRLSLSAIFALRLLLSGK